MHGEKDQFVLGHMGEIVGQPPHLVLGDACFITAALHPSGLIIDHPTVSDHANEIRVGIDIVFQSTLPNVILIRVKKAAHVPVL